MIETAKTIRSQHYHYKNNYNININININSITSMLVLCLFSPDSAVSPPRTTSRVELSFSRGQTCERSSMERRNKLKSGGQRQRQRQRQRSEVTKTKVVATSCSEQMTVSSASPSQVPMPGSFSLVRVCQCHVAFVLLSSL